MTESAEQLALPAPLPPPQYGVIVDEVLLNSLGGPFLDWWFVYAGRYEQRGRARVLDIIIAGAITEYGPFSQDDAEFLHDHLIEKGAHFKALKVRRWTEHPHMAKCRKGAPCRLCVERNRS